MMALTLVDSNLALKDDYGVLYAGENPTPGAK
jgi:hypothetical protein